MRNFTKRIKHLASVFSLLLFAGFALNAQTYCIPISDTQFGEYINLFSTTGCVTDINNPSGNDGGYGDFYATHHLQQDAGGTVNFTIGFAGGGTFGSRIWVDWGNDGVFDPSDVVFMSPTYHSGPQTGSFTIPAGTANGDYRMRINQSWGASQGSTDPCDNTGIWGEYEDYKVTVGAGGGGSGGACSTPILEVSQDEDNTCMANFTQTGLAQSYKPLEPYSAGAGIKLRDLSTGLDLTLSLWDGLPNAGGTMLASGTTQTSGGNWVDVFWSSVVSVTVGDTYYIVIEGNSGLPCISGTTSNPYPDGMVFANNFDAFPSFDYTFRTYSCDEATGACYVDCPADFTIEAAAPDCQVYVEVIATIEGECTGGEEVTNDFNGGGANASGMYPIGTTEVTFTMPGSGSCTVSVTVVNTLEPMIDCPADRTVTMQPGECYYFFYDEAPSVLNYCGAGGGGTGDLEEISQLVSYPVNIDDAIRCASVNGTTGAHSRAYEALPYNFKITGMDVASWDPGQQIVSFYEYTGPMGGQFLDRSAMTLIYESPAFTVPGGQQITHYDFPDDVIIPAGSNYVVEQHVPSNYTGWLIASTYSGQTAKSYMSCTPSADPEDYGTWQGGYSMSLYQVLYGESVAGGSTPKAELCEGGIQYGDPLGIGDHEICWTWTDDEGNEYFCTYTITVEEYPYVNPSLTCNDLIHVDLGKDCHACINAAHLLEGGPYGCYESRYTVIVATDAGFTNIIGEGSEVCFDGSHAGGTFYGKVIDNVSGNSCSGVIKVFDTHIPELECGSYTVDCGDSIYPDSEVEVVDGLVLNYSHDTVSIIDALACAGTGTAVNNYYRVFDMDLLDIPGDFNVEKFNLGIYQSFSNINCVVRFYTFNNPSDYDVNAQSFSLSLTSQIGDDIDVVIPNGLNGSVHSWDISDAEIEIPLSARYVVAHIEIEGNPADWVAGVNSAGEDGPSYLSAVDCGVTDPSTYASIGFGDLHLVMMVYGSSGSGVGFPLPEGVTVTPTTGEGPFIVSGFDVCGDVTMTYEDTVVDGDCSTEFATVIYRDWTAIDESGNTTSCQDTINIRHPDINNFEFPGDVEYLLSDYGCDYDFANEDFGLEQGVCGMFYGWEDRVLELCGEGQKIIRDYYAMYCCSGEVAEGRQIIKIIDDIAPEFDCPADVTLSTGYYECDADYAIAPIVATKCGKEMNWPADWDIVSSAGTVTVIGGNVVIRDMPVGTHTVTYTVTDDCGNSASCVQLVTVRDDVPPVAVCDHNTRVSIGADGEARVHWTTIEDGSYDNCEIVQHEVRRKNVSRYCGRNNVWGEYVYFCCADVGNLVEVEYRVTDASGNTNICVVNVTVENGIPPQMAAPGPITVSCEFGDLPSKSDLKDLFDSNQGAALGLLRDIFGKVADLDAGESRDEIVITDSGIRGCGYGNTTNNWGIDGFAVHNCGLNIKESYVDNRNECGVGRIFRSWQLLNDLDQPIGQPVNQVVTVENCNPFGIADITWPRDLTITGSCGDYEENNWGEPSYNLRNDCHMVAATYTDEVYELVANDCEYKVLRHWTVINCCVDNKVPGNGIWTYTQEIRIKSIQDAPVIDVADVTTCANELDCSDTHVDLVASATSCVPGEMLKWSYRVDMNSNGDWDRVGVGADASGFYGMGTHTVEFTVEDGCGNRSVKTVTVTVNDCTKPTPVCYTLATEVMDPAGYVDLPAKLFDAGSWDNCTSSENLIISYSSDVTDLVRRFTCDDLGLIEVEIWVTDEAGNQAFCRQILDLQDNENVCPDDGSLVSGRVGVESTDAPAVGFEVEVERSNVPAPLLLETDNTGSYSFVAGVDYSYDISSNNNDNPLNGVSTWDLTLIQQHILGMNEIVSPYKLIAADINRDGRITPVDLVELRRVILQLDKEFANNSSWQMVVASANLPSGVVPTNYEQVISLSDVSGAISGQDFVAVKIGDVNNSANASEGRSGNEFVMSVADINYVRGEEVRVPVMAGSDASIFGYQMTLEVASNLRYTGIEAGAFDISGEHVGAHRVSEGLLSMSWNDVNALSVSEGEVLFTLVFEAVEGGSLNHALVASDVITRNEAYVNGEIDRVVMRVGSDASGLFALYQNEPNPFGDITSISFDLPESGAATLTVYNAQGQVEHVIEGNYESGRTTISIERSELGAAGIKYYSLKSGDYTATKKMIVIK